MGRPSILPDRAMTPAERQQRHRAKLREIVNVEQVLAALAHDYGRAVLIEQKEIRAGVKKLLARWHRDDAALRRYWDKRLRRKSRTP
jgi:hypothetical protein